MLLNWDLTSLEGDSHCMDVDGLLKKNRGRILLQYACSCPFKGLNAVLASKRTAYADGAPCASIRNPFATPLLFLMYSDV